MHPIIKILFEYIERMEDEIDTLKKGKATLATPSHIRLREWAIEKVKVEIQKISATLNPHIPEPYASMSRDEILGGIGQYDSLGII
jgi:predicted solute-binding protein